MKTLKQFTNYYNVLNDFSVTYQVNKLIISKSIYIDPHPVLRWDNPQGAELWIQKWTRYKLLLLVCNITDNDNSDSFNHKQQLEK